MAIKRPASRRNGAAPAEDNTCAYCLYFHPWEPQRRPLGGNCSHYKEWIENASQTTCSEMSNRPLDQKGIYEIIPTRLGPTYVHRKQKQRTRLFRIK